MFTSNYSKPDAQWQRDFCQKKCSKKSGTIKVNSPSLSRRTFKVPGRGPVPQGRPLQDRSGKVQMVVTEDGDMIARSGKALKFTAKKKHNLAKSVKENETAPKKHTKQ